MNLDVNKVIQAYKAKTSELEHELLIYKIYIDQLQEKLKEAEERDKDA